MKRKAVARRVDRTSGNAMALETLSVRVRASRVGVRAWRSECW